MRQTRPARLSLHPSSKYCRHSTQLRYVNTASRPQTNTMLCSSSLLPSLAPSRHRCPKPPELPTKTRPGLGSWRRGRRRVLDWNRRPVPCTTYRRLGAGHLGRIQDPQISHSQCRPVIQIPSQPLRTPCALLYAAEFLEEFSPSDDTFFSALEPVGPVERGSTGGRRVAERDRVSFNTGTEFGTGRGGLKRLDRFHHRPLSRV